VIEGKVAQILNERELVINIGTKSGVKKGTRFIVLAESPLEIRDPDSKEPLGVLDREKVRVEASDVAENFSVCQTYETVVTGGGFDIGSLSLFGPRREEPRTLRAASDSFPPPLSPEESYVKIGDRVKELTR